MRGVGKWLIFAAASAVRARRKQHQGQGAPDVVASWSYCAGGKTATSFMKCETHKARELTSIRQEGSGAQCGLSESATCSPAND